MVILYKVISNLLEWFAGLSSNDVSQLGIIVKNPDTHERFLREMQKTLARKNGVFFILAANNA